jgi:dienelactone hydrolase
VRAAAQEVLNYTGGPAYAAAKTLEKTSLDSLTVEQVVFETEPDLPIPGLVFVPPGRGPHPALLLLHDRGKDVEAGPEGLAPALARAGCLTMALDLRGRGETAWKRRSPIEADDLGLLGDESMLAYVCYLLGEWALAQRVADTVRALDALGGRADVDSGRVGVVGRGGGALVALHAAALDGRVKGVAAYEALASYRAVVEADRCAHPVSGFVPGVLLRYDLPDLVGALAPASALIANPLDAAGEVLSPEAAGAAYAQARRMYELLGGDLGVKPGLNRTELVGQIKAWAGRL